jgi:hypothetical protein
MTASVKISFYVQPRAARTEIVGQHGADLKIRLAAAPIDNAANVELIAFIARELHLPKRNIRLLSGRASRRKSVAIEGAGAEALAVLRGAAPATITAHGAASSNARKRALRDTR